MERFVINGGNVLKGEISVMGSKNAATKLMTASLLFDSPVVFSNIPEIDDVKKTSELLEKLGSKIDFEKGTMRIDSSRAQGFVLDHEIAKNMRASVVFLGPLLARFGRAEIPHPGGCVIGKRPINYFIDGLDRLGATVQESDGFYKFSVNKLKGAEIFMPFPSVTATETLMMAAILAGGETIIKNAASEPEIQTLTEFLIHGGAEITGAGTSTINIKGLDGRLLKIHNHVPFEVPPDRIEAGSFVILGALTGDPLKVTNCRPEHLEALLASLKNSGVQVERGENWIEVARPEKLTAGSITTAVYPGFATDLQSPFAVLLTQAAGESRIFETVFEGRLNYLEELRRMGANIIPCDPHRAIIIGPTELHGREMESPDLRAGLAFVIAALIAEGKSEVGNIHHIDRGYAQIETRLQKIGAKIKRVSD